MRRPCREDLEEAAEFLLANKDEAGVNSRVGQWLASYAKDSHDRSEARNAGVSVHYLRNIMRKGK